MKAKSQNPTLSLVYCLLLICLTSISNAFTENGGFDAHPAAFPGYARLIVAGKLQCSAVKVGPKAYISAGHCVGSPAFSRGRRLKIVNLGGIEAVITSTSIAPTQARAQNPISGRPLRQDLAMFTIDRELPQLRTADLSFVLGKMRYQSGDTFRQVGMRDMRNNVYGFADTTDTSLDAFCITTHNQPSNGSIRPGDSGGPLYVVRGRHAFLAGITIEYVSEVRVSRDSRGRKVTSTRAMQRFTRLDLGSPSKADQWLIDQLRAVQSTGLLDSSGQSRANFTSNSGVFSGHKERKVFRRRWE